MKEYFNFYDFTIGVSSASAGLLEEIRRDFSYFRVPVGKNDMQIKINISPPPYSELPSVPATLITPRNVCFRNNKTTYVDYFGKGMAIYDRQNRDCVIHGIDPDLVHEIVYHFILSTVGQYLDSKRIHRIHALGVCYYQRNILLVLPSGGGKSTLVLKLLHCPGFKLLSDDTPLIDRHGNILPFPLRLGVQPGQTQGIPEKSLRTVKRMEFEPKTLIDLEFFKDRLAESGPPDFLLIGERNLGEVSEITPLAKRKVLKTLIRYMVVGLGIYQGLEFLLERGVWDIALKTRLILSRLYNSMRLLSRSQSYRFVLGRNTEINYMTLHDFIQKKGK
ncbi:MAG: hypothetical protein JSV96_12690 [Candidatus Aminicenantes bacterium]|nr:MAG: hypothetical protein JSV96_12690 [Candidatus Aminicenantes bacterium]